MKTILTPIDFSSVSDAVVMEAAALAKKEFIVLDRPNPNGHYIDGPVMTDSNLFSFVGQLHIPIVHGCTLGEMAKQRWQSIPCPKLYSTLPSYRCCQLPSSRSSHWR